MASTARAYPTPYIASPPPLDPSGLNVYLQKELAALQRTIAGVVVMLPQDAIAAPAKPQDGMIRRSMAPWRPVAGQTADRWVIYLAGAWGYLNEST